MKSNLIFIINLSIILFFSKNIFKICGCINFFSENIFIAKNKPNFIKYHFKNDLKINNKAEKLLNKKNYLGLVVYHGGLGNQLFQYCFGYILKKMTGRNILYDYHHLIQNKNKHNIYEIINFKAHLSNEIITEKKQYYKDGENAVYMLKRL